MSEPDLELTTGYSGKDKETILHWDCGNSEGIRLRKLKGMFRRFSWPLCYNFSTETAAKEKHGYERSFTLQKHLLFRR